MNVKRMIKELSKYSPDAEVLLNDRNGLPALFVLGLQNDEGHVWLETEADCDMANELAARFKEANEKQMDETDFYMDLLEIGVTLDMVRGYMGDEAANHMESYCKEHGLI